MFVSKKGGEKSTINEMSNLKKVKLNNPLNKIFFLFKLSEMKIKYKVYLFKHVSYYFFVFFPNVDYKRKKKQLLF